MAGVNGAGKSSIMGSMLLQQGISYFNPDEAAQRIRLANASMTRNDANSAAWHEGKRLLQRAIAEQLDFTFETTLGGNTIPDLLEKALQSGIEVRVWYAGLNSPELHIARVRARVEQGGHPIPEPMIRQRYHRSRVNLIRLVPHLTELMVYDNSKEADPWAGLAPEPLLVLHMKRGSIVRTCDLPAAPTWTKPILMAAFRCVPKQ